MAELVHVPFVHGITESVDEKILPDGWFKSAKNVRFARDARIVKRLGYVETLNYVISPEDDGRLYVRGDEKLWWNTGLLAYREAGTDVAAWSGKANYTGHMPSQLRRSSVFRDSSVDVVDSAIIGDLTCVVTGNQASGGVNAYVYQGGTLIHRQRISGTRQAPKIVAVGDNFIVVVRDNSGTTLVGHILDTADIASGFDFTGTNLFASDANAPFDVSDGDATSWTLVSSSAGNVRVVRLDETCAVVANNGTETSVDPSALAVDGGVGAQSIFVAWRAGNTIAYRSYTASGATISASHAITTIETDALNAGSPAISRVDGTNALLYWSRRRNSVGSVVYHVRTCSIDGSGTAGSVTAQYGGMLVSKIGVFDGVRYGVVADPGYFDRAYYLLDLSNGTRVVASFARTLAVDLDKRPLTMPRLDVSGSTMTYGTLVVSAGSPADDPLEATGADLTTWVFGDADRQSVDVRGSLWFTGAMPLIYAGGAIREVGFSGSPVIEDVSSKISTGGLVGASTYAYKITWERLDESGNVERSIPSMTKTITLGASDNTVDVLARFPSWSFQYGSIIAGGKWRVHVWRTEAGPGSIFYRVTSAAGLQQDMSNSATELTLTDTFTDAQLVSNPSLYTNTGDQIAHAQVSAHRFAAVGDERLFLGGLENPRMVQWSLFFTPGEGVHFADAPNFVRELPEDITAVAFFDGLFVAFTAAGVYVTSGDGPDDTGAGEYPPFRRLPSVVGCVSHHSLLLTDDGLFFQSTDSSLYLMPRGGGAPVFQGTHVRDTLQAYPVITDTALVSAEHIAVFACQNSSQTAGVLLVYDLRNKEWTIDEINGGDPVDSVVVWSGRIGLRLRDQSTRPLVETGGVWADAGSFYVAELETGDIRPFGDRGWGQIIAAHAWGDYREDCALEVALSFDSGATYAADNTGEWDMLTGEYAVGDAFDRQLYSATRKSSRVRARIRINERSAGSLADTEGLALNGLSLAVVRAKNLPRLKSASRL